MSEKPRAVRGMNDILPEVSGTWRYLETVVQEIVASYGYREIRLPLLEQTELFKRSIGEVTDIVEKEMYTFPDRNGDLLTLRPEATAGLVRAGITNACFTTKNKNFGRLVPCSAMKSRSKAAIGSSTSSTLRPWDLKAPMSMQS